MTASSTRPRRPGTAARALDVAETLVQQRGFNGFSYADVAGELGITTASLHYHFPGKAELGSALIRRYSDRFSAALDAIDAQHQSAPEKLRAYAALYGDVLGRGRMCLCGMLAADFETLPATMRDGVVAFFDANEAWVAKVLEEGRIRGDLQFEGAPIEVARTLIAGLEGIMLVARPFGDVGRFERAAERLLQSLAGSNTH